MFGRGLRAGAWLLLLALALGQSRLPIAALQGTAWVKMYFAYSETYDPETALRLTFNGEELCDLCHAVVDLESSNQDLPDLALSFFTGWGFLPSITTSITVERPMERQWPYPDTHLRLSSRYNLPALPPPKAS